MPVDLRRQPLETLIRDHPGWLVVLGEFGIDGREGTSISLAAAADRANVEVEVLLAAMSGPRREWDCENIDCAPIRALLRHIEDDHHVLLRRQLVEITRAIHDERLARPDDAALAVLHDRFAAFRADMETHLETEETALFPLCRDLIDAFSWPSFHSGPVVNPIRMLQHDHDHFNALLAEVVDVCEPDSAVVRQIRSLGADLDQHLLEENELLFPAVVRLAEELMN